MRKTLLTLILIAGMLMLGGADWLRFRGPNASGTLPNVKLPTDLDAAKNVAWKVDLPGRGLSSPIIVGDRVFVTASAGREQTRLHVICFNAEDGSKRWERRFWATGRTMTHNKTCVAAPTPASDGKHLYALFSSNDLVCLDLDGNLKWLRGLTHDYPNASNSLGMSSSLMVVDDTLIAQIENDSESFAAGIDTKTGVNRWKMERPASANWTSPLLLQRDGGDLALLQSSAGVHAVEPRTGKVVWSYRDGASTIPSGAVGSKFILAVSHGLTALRHIDGSEAPEIVWRESALGPSTASPIVLGGKIYTVNKVGVITAARESDGETLWKTRITGPFSASPVAANGHLYFVNEKGVLQVVDVSGDDKGELVGSLDLKETILGTPSIGHDALYVRSDEHLWKIAK